MKDIEGFEDLYAACEDGQIWCYPRPFSNNQYKGNTFLKNTVYSCGYSYVWLYKEGDKKRFRIHRLIAKTFIPNPKNLPYINHKNGIKTDNRIENLEWYTAKENDAHAFRNGLRKPFCKLTREQVEEIRRIYTPRGINSTYALGIKYNVHHSTIAKAISGVNWH